jgi:hypothetical protein
MKLIGFIGRRGSGKDTAAQVLVAQGFEVVRFAGAIKEMLRAYLRYVGESKSTIEEMIEGSLKEAPTSHLGNKSPRWAMQTLGTEWGRQQMAWDFWLKACLDRCAQFDKVVVTDARFKNEVEALLMKGGKIIRITRPGTATDEHESERFVEKLPADCEILNNGSINDLHAQVLEFLNGTK